MDGFVLAGGIQERTECIEGELQKAGVLEKIKPFLKPETTFLSWLRNKS